MFRRIPRVISLVPGLDPKALLGILFSGPLRPGPFHFELDGVRLR